MTPFFIDEYRIHSLETAFVKLDEISDEKAAKELTGKTIFAPKKFLKQIKAAETGIEYFVGFQISDKENGLLGTITEIDQSTANLLMIIENGENQLLVPFSESYIINIDHNTKKIFVNLPEGLFDL